MTTDLTQRYGAPRRWQRTTTLVLAGLVAASGLAWLASATLDFSTPDVQSELVTYEVVDDHEARARLDVTVLDGVEATCQLRAIAADHSLVGEKAFTPAPGTNEVVVRTERRADRIEKVGCTTPDQDRPR